MLTVLWENYGFNFIWYKYDTEHSWLMDGVVWDPNALYTEVNVYCVGL